MPSLKPRYAVCDTVGVIVDGDKRRELEKYDDQNGHKAIFQYC